ncbi:hypothetical protein V5O48_014913 [Marasmius crinis-equi]|uniref:BTB domain-containing protein n=1 Tax=Marasmius crinis-equi TaxID=585013 RepID=A0ABR3EVZ5_9AGAR
MNNESKLREIKASKFYIEFRVPKTQKYVEWVEDIPAPVWANYARWLDLRSTNLDTEERQISVVGVDGTYKIHAGLLEILQGQHYNDEIETLSGFGYKENVVQAVVELAYHLHQPFPLLHDILVDASIPPFPSGTLEEKYEIIKLAYEWNLDPVANLVSVGMDVEEVMNVYQHAYIRYEAKTNNWQHLLDACHKKEEDLLFCQAVFTTVQTIAENDTDPKNKRLYRLMIEDLIDKLVRLGLLEFE